MKSIKLSCGNVIQVDVESEASDVVSWTDFFIAVDDCGEVWAFTEKPSREDGYAVWDSDGESWEIGKVVAEEFSGNYTDLISTLTFVACLDDIVVTPEDTEENKEHDIAVATLSEANDKDLCAIASHRRSISGMNRALTTESRYIKRAEEEIKLLLIKIKSRKHTISVLSGEAK